MHRFLTSLLLLFAIGAAHPALGDGQSAVRDPAARDPAVRDPAVRALAALEPYVLPAIDAGQVRLADERRAAAGRVPHYAEPIEVAIDPFGDVGTWEVGTSAGQAQPGELARWRLRLVSSGALSLNLAFTRYRMPPGGSLELISTDGRHRVGPLTARDNEDHGELWTPPMPTGDLVLELRLPVSEIDGLELELSQVYHGYAGFGEADPRSGACHRDVACSEAEPWADQARSVALISVAGSRFCTGFMVNNTALDGKPFLITANHCGVTPRNAASVVVMWNYQRGACGDDLQGGARATDIGDFQTGAIWRAAHRPSDTLLLELDDPPGPFGVYYAGWDRSPADPARSVVIHHPNTDVKRISFDFDRAITTRHLGPEPRPGGDHVRIAEWDMGSTEGGSSGAPLFNQDGRAVGQLHGGYAACGDGRADWFGRFSAAWAGDVRSAARLSDWLDPLDTGAVTLDGLDSTAIGDLAPEK